MTDAVNGVNQDDYMKLFMQELTYQDPLKPVDNREFMTQMAQFSALQQAQTTNGSLAELVGMTNGSQALMLIGKHVKIKGSEEQGLVQTVAFPPHEAPRLSISMKGGTIEKLLEDVTEVQ